MRARRHEPLTRKYGRSGFDVGWREAIAPRWVTPAAEPDRPYLFSGPRGYRQDSGPDPGVADVWRSAAAPRTCGVCEILHRYAGQRLIVSRDQRASTPASESAR